MTQPEQTNSALHPPKRGTRVVLHFKPWSRRMTMEGVVEGGNRHAWLVRDQMKFLRIIPTGQILRIDFPHNYPEGYTP